MSGTDLTQEAAFLPHLMSRRRLIAAVGGVASLSAIGMRAYGQEATPTPSGTPVASPEASPVGTPVGSPVAEATPIAEPPEMIGNLRIVRDQWPIYTTRPRRGGTSLRSLMR